MSGGLRARKEKRSTLKAARRSMAMAEEEEAAVRTPLTEVAYKEPSFLSPLRMALRFRIKQLFPTLAHPFPAHSTRKMLGTPHHLHSGVAGQPGRFVCCMGPCGRKGARRDHSVCPFRPRTPLPRRQYKTAAPPNKPPPPPIPSLPPRDQDGSGLSQSLTW